MIDENHGSTPELLRALNQCGIAYRTLKECGISAGTSDEAILRVAGEHGWILLTTDKSIRRNALEFRAAVAFGVRQFVFSNNNMNGRELAEALRRGISKLVELCGREAAPFIASIGKSGAVQLIYDCQGRVTGDSAKGSREKRGGRTCR
jgi:predicted nuclease of predicted toxin-antitoxin system